MLIQPVVLLHKKICANNLKTCAVMCIPSPERLGDCLTHARTDIKPLMMMMMTLVLRPYCSVVETDITCFQCIH